MTFNVSLKPIQFGAANGDIFTVPAAVKNPNNYEATDTVKLLVDDTVRDSRTVTLSSNDNQRIKLAWTVNVEKNKQLSVTVQTSTDSASDETTFYLYDDVQRVRFDEDTREAGINAEQNYVESIESIGVDAE